MTLPRPIARASTIRLVIVGVIAFRATLSALAAPPVDDGFVRVTAVPAQSVYGGQPDVLGLDVAIGARRGDALDALVVQNIGTAQWQRDVTAATLWADAGAPGFQGIGVDDRLASGAWVASTNGWVFDRLDTMIPEHGRRFFVTVSLYHTPADGGTIQLGIPTYSDAAHPMEFDPGDTGVFLRTARPLPLAPIANPSAHRVIRPTADSFPPVVRITEPVDGASFARDWLLVRGIAVDVGGSAPAKVLIGVNRPGRATTWIEATPEVAAFATWEARLFGLPLGETIELRVVGEDWVGNRSSASAPVVVRMHNTP